MPQRTATILLLSACAAIFVSAEPPVNNYLPPQQQQQPSSQYGAPSGFGSSGSGFQKPSSQYGAPSNSYVAPSNSYIPPQQSNNNNNYQPSASYGAPSVTSAVFKPSPSYGAPSAQQGYSGSGSGGYGNGGYENNEPARYNFEYNVQDYQSGNDFGHMESRDGDRTTGRYYVLLPDGRKQVSFFFKFQKKFILFPKSI